MQFIELINNTEKYFSKETFLAGLAILERIQFDRTYKMNSLRPCGRYLYVLD